MSLSLKQEYEPPLDGKFNSILVSTEDTVDPWGRRALRYRVGDVEVLAAPR